MDLLKEARELVDSIDPVDNFEAQLGLEGLRGVVAGMWESACDCSESHQEILAVLENGVRIAGQTGSVKQGQLAAFREALNDLGQSRLVRENAEVVRAEFLRQGFTALAFIEDMDETR